MFTQCPKCQSVFMVSEKDVKAHEGLVRCGNCYSVFNSSWNLTEDPRDDFIEDVASVGKTATPVSESSAFTFSIMHNTAEVAAVSASAATQAEEEKPATVTSRVEPVEEKVDETPPEADLEPFPEPEQDDFENPLSAPGSSKDQDSLLYFDSNTEDADEESTQETSDGLTPIEDLTLLQTPSITNEIPAIDQNISELKPDDKELPRDATLSEESMWPGGEEEQKNESTIELPAVSDGSEDNAAASSEESSRNVSDEVHDDGIPPAPIPAKQNPPVTPHAVEIRVDDAPILSPKIESEPEQEEPVLDSPSTDSVSPENNEDRWLDDIVTEAANIEGMPVLGIDDVEPSSGEVKSATGDDTFYVEGEANETKEFSIDSLPKTAEEAFSTEKKVSDAGDSVFITSEEEETDDSYVPITLRKGRQDELFHGLDDFPEPGELSALNYEDTMEINAMLEEANISKEQIESAMSAAEITDDDGGGDSEDIVLSSDGDLTDALFPSSGATNRNGAGGRSKGKSPSNSVAKLFRNLVPARRSRKSLKNQEEGDDQTQLIRSLHRSNSQSALPVWVSKYSLLAGISILVVLLLSQIGFFYMDKLVRITPLRPLLEAGCMVAGCTVPEVQNIDQIQQLSSRLTPLSEGGGEFKVSSILVNRGIRSQLFPALELILTDRAGNMISRRVVTSGVYRGNSKTKLMKPNEAVDIDIRFRTPSIRVDGFELRAVSQNWLERTE